MKQLTIFEHDELGNLRDRLTVIYLAAQSALESISFSERNAIDCLEEIKDEVEKAKALLWRNYG